MTLVYLLLLILAIGVCVIGISLYILRDTD